MADINNNDIWIDVETLAKLKNITRRAVRLALNQNKYEYKVENIRGGKTYKIKLSTLEEELQLKYFQEYYDDYKTCDNEVIELSNLNIKQEKLISENQRKIALAKYDLIYAWLDFRKEYKGQYDFMLDTYSTLILLNNCFFSDSNLSFGQSCFFHDV